MKDPYLVNKRNRRTKIKILVSFNGGFRRRQPSGKLRYTGGETRILSVDRGITFFKLKSQVLELVVQSGNGCCTLFSLKYQLQDCSESERSDLFSITSDDDVACMIDEFEKREFQGKLTRLWVFACSNNNGFLDNYDLHGIKSCGDINMKTHLSKSDHNKGSSNKKLSSDDSVRKMKLSSDDSLRKMVLKQQLLAKQYFSSNRIRRDYSESGNYRVNNMLDYEYRSCDFGGNGNFQKDLPIPLSKSRALNSKDNNLRLGVNCSMNGPLEKSDCSGVSLESGRPGAELPSLESSRIDRVDAKLEATCVDSTQLSSLNRENIVPRSMDCDMGRNGVDLLSRNNQLIASVPAPMQGNQEVLVGGTPCSLRNNRVGLSESRNARIYPYQIRNRGNGYEMGKHHSLRLNGKSSIGKILPDLRYGSSILKRGQTARSYSFTSSKNGSGHQCPTVKDMTEMNDDSCALEEVVDHLNYGSIVRSDGSPLPINSDTRPMNRQKDLLSCPDTGKPETQCQALSRDVHDSSTSCQSLSDISKDLGSLDQQEVNESISLEDSLNWSCGSTTSSCNQKTADSFQQSISSVLDLSLHDLNLSKSSKLELEGSPHARNDISLSFLKPVCHNSDAMDEEYLSSGPQVEESSGDVSCSLVDSDFRKKNNSNNSEEDIQHNTQTNPSICEQVEIEKTKKSSNVNGVIPADISAYNPYAAKPGLQTIKNTDLEYIKELGSGTYGTVFYGKWKGSDVAIKRLKPSCFTEGTVEEDRLVTDFWKEAHILGQLHHPNIVALYGVVIDGPVTNLATVTEYMVNGSLKQVLRRKDRTIDRRKRLIIAMDAAFGMEYLHEKNIVHFDLKSHNFLVNMRDPQRPVCKIGDLGLSKIKQRTLVSGGVRGTIPWMAPELLNGENMVSEKVDVYSFGIVMWELLTGEEPYSKMRAEEVIVGIISGSLRPDVPSWCDPGWRSLMERCWSSDPKARPAFSEIAKELRAMAAAMNIK